MPHFYVRLSRPILTSARLVQQTKKNNHQVSKKHEIFLQVHYSYTFANLAELLKQSLEGVINTTKIGFLQPKL